MIVYSSTKKCGTCNFWCGARELKSMGRQAEFYPNDAGSCNKPGSTSRLLENKQAQFGCPDWEKWGPMQ
jgi:hypothetical protein